MSRNPDEVTDVPPALREPARLRARLRLPCVPRRSCSRRAFLRQSHCPHAPRCVLQAPRATLGHRRREPGSYFSKGSTYRISHPAECGDRGTVFIASPRVLCDIIRELDPSIDDRPDRPFPFVTGSCDSAVFWRHRQIVQSLEGLISPLEPLWADVTALQLIADVLDTAFAQKGQPRRRHRNGTDAITPSAPRLSKTTLQAGFLIESHSTASRVPCTLRLFILRVFFRARTGLPIHRYLTRLRLRASLERLSGGTTDLTRSPSSSAFPATATLPTLFAASLAAARLNVRRHGGRNWFGEMSKNLEV